MIYIIFFLQHLSLPVILSYVESPITVEDATLRKREREAKKNAQTEGRSRKPGNLRSQTRISCETFNPVSVLSRKILCISLMSLCERSLLRLETESD